MKILLLSLLSHSQSLSAKQFTRTPPPQPQLQHKPLYCIPSSPPTRSAHQHAYPDLVGTSSHDATATIKLLITPSAQSPVFYHRTTYRSSVIGQSLFKISKPTDGLVLFYHKSHTTQTTITQTQLSPPQSSLDRITFINRRCTSSTANRNRSILV